MITTCQQKNDIIDVLLSYFRTFIATIIFFCATLLRLLTYRIIIRTLNHYPLNTYVNIDRFGLHYLKLCIFVWFLAFLLSSHLIYPVKEFSTLNIIFSIIH